MIRQHQMPIIRMLLVPPPSCVLEANDGPKEAGVVAAMCADVSCLCPPPLHAVAAQLASCKRAPEAASTSAAGGLFFGEQEAAGSSGYECNERVYLSRPASGATAAAAAAEVSHMRVASSHISNQDKPFVLSSINSASRSARPPSQPSDTSSQ